MAGREVGVEGDEHLEGARVVRVVDDQLGQGEGEREEDGGGQAGDQDGVPEHLTAWQGGGRQPEDGEEEGQSGEQGHRVHGEADQVLALLEHDEVVGGVGLEQEEQS